MTTNTAPKRQKRVSARSNTLHVRVEPELCDAIIDACVARGMSPSEWVRQAARTCAMLEGALVAPRDAGSLYDQVEGRQRWARIKDGAIVGLYYHTERPEQDGYVWLPVVHEDSEPFDIAKHWRLAPRYTIVDVYATPDRVICTYPVVPKSAELA